MTGDLEKAFKYQMASALSFAILIFAQSVCAFQTQPVSDDQFARITSKIQTQLDTARERIKFPGASAGFILPDGRFASVSTGVADRERNIPLKPSDRMLAGSIGKTFVAVSALLLVQDGKLSLDEKIERWLGHEKWFAALPNSKDITLRMLLDHTSGIPDHVDDKRFLSALEKRTDDIKYDELLAYILNKKPLFTAGTAYSYADTNYIVAAMIIERASGKTLYDFINERITTPLKLERTLPSNSLVIPEVANGYYKNKPVIVNGKFIINPQWEWAGGGFASTTGDLARWARALYEGRVLSRSMLDEMINSTSTGDGASYGLGVEITNTKFGKAYGHDGEFPGYLSDMKYFLNYRIAVAVQVNEDRDETIRFVSTLAEDVAQTVVEEIAGKPISEGDKLRLQLKALDWLKLVDERRFAESWNGIAADLKAKYPQGKWQATLGPLLDKAGKIRKRNFKSVTRTDASSVVIEFESSFTRSSSAREILILRSEQDGNWRVASYTIK